MNASDSARANLRGADLRAADLAGQNLVGADLRDADLRGANLTGADLSGSLLHGADLRDTRVGNGGLGHRGGDPELTFIYDPEIFGARADDLTRWPAEFKIFGAGVVYDGPHGLPVSGSVDVPVEGRDGRGLGGWGYGSSDELRAATHGTGHVRDVRGWLALIQTDDGKNVSVPGDRLLACNLRLLKGQPASYGPFTQRGASGDDTEGWIVAAHDDAHGTLELRREAEVVVVAATQLFEHNVDRWWWHVPGAEWTARD